MDISDFRCHGETAVTAVAHTENMAGLCKVLDMFTILQHLFKRDSKPGNRQPVVAGSPIAPHTHQPHHYSRL